MQVKSKISVCRNKNSFRPVRSNMNVREMFSSNKKYGFDKIYLLRRSFTSKVDYLSQVLLHYRQSLSCNLSRNFVAIQVAGKLR